MKLKCITYNCKGLKYRNYMYINKLYDKNDILFLQEHWLFPSEFKIINDIIPEADFHFVSAMNDNDLLSGRPYGGVGIIFKKNKNILFKPIVTQSKRICALDCVVNDNKFLLLSIYMPCNTPDKNDEFNEVLSEIKVISNLYPEYQLIIAGDFNCALNSSDLRNNNFLNFLIDLDLVCPTAIEPSHSFTFINSLGNKSLIDHFCLDSSVVEMISDFDIISEGDNLSDHLPVMMEIKLPCPLNIDRGGIFSNNINVPKSRFDWSNANGEDICDFKLNLDNHLSKIDVPLNSVICNDFSCSDHYDEFLKFHFDIIDACARSTIESIGKCKIKNPENKLIGWNKLVRPYKDSAILWHKIWKDSGSPSSGIIFDIRKNTRSKYHREIKDVKSKQDKLKKDKISDSMLKNEIKDFWKCVNREKGNFVQAPDLIDGEYGDKACKVFKDKYSRLYQTDDKDSIINLSNENKADISKCTLNNDNFKHVHSTNLDLIKRAVTRLKGNKTECDSILNSNAIKNGTDKLFLYISFLFTIMIRHGFSNDIFNTVTFNPIIKNARKSKNDSNNYRAVALNSLFSKLLDYVVLEIFENELTSSHFQFAYKSAFSTSLCTFITKETIEYYLNNGSNVYATFLDCTKAFDLVKHVNLFRILIDKGICPLIIRLLLNMYVDMKGKVKWKTFMSDNFEVYNGIKQGGVISPILFSLYIDKLIYSVQKCNFG